MTKQTWDPAGYAEKAGFVPALGQPVIDLLNPQPGERILDLGCGEGQLTKALAHRGADVVGLDASRAFVEATRARGLDARFGDGQALTFDAEFDAVFSNAALHWMPDLDAVIAGVFRALKPGGRFAAEFGAKGNVAACEGALLDELAARGVDGRSVVPWTFPSGEDYRERLQRAGFTVSKLITFQRPTALGSDALGWLETFGRVFAECLPTSERGGYFRAVQDRLRPSLYSDDAGWQADYVRLRFLATKA